jgi:CheY-like chemotaxis protein
MGSERRGFPRVGITESIKVEPLDGPGSALATFGSTVDVSRGGLEAILQGAPIAVGCRCVVRFLSTTRIKPAMTWGKVVSVTEGPGERRVRIEFDTPLQKLELTPRRIEGDGAKTSVLVVDDELPVCDILSRFLTRRGFRVEVRRNGEEALSAIRAEVPDVLLLDIYMPKLNGIDLLTRVREEGLKPAVVIGISGASSQDEARELLSLGANDFLVKPIDLNYLSWAIRLRL